MKRFKIIVAICLSVFIAGIIAGSLFACVAAIGAACVAVAIAAVNLLPPFNNYKDA